MGGDRLDGSFASVPEGFHPAVDPITGTQVIPE